MEQLYVGWTAPDEWTKYSVVVDRDGVYSVSLLYTSNRRGKQTITLKTVEEGQMNYAWLEFTAK